MNGGSVPWALAAICTAAFLGAMWLTSGVSPLRPDTASYLYFDPSRPIGYPAFLWFIGRIGGTLAAVPVQMSILTAALFLLGWAFYRWTGSALLSGLFQLALVASPEMWKFSATLITEAPATAAVALWCAQLLNILRKPSTTGVVLLSIISGVGMLMKPSLIVMFAATAVAAWLLPLRSDRRVAIIAAVVGLGATLAITPMANLLVHGSTASGSPLARGVLQHSLFCPPSRSFADPDAAFVEQQVKPVRDYIALAPPETRHALERMYTGKLRFGLIIPALGWRHRLQAGWQTDPLIWKIAKERILANPSCYAESVIRSYFSLATYKSYSPAETRRLDQWLETRPPPAIPVVRLLPDDERSTILAAKAVGAAEPRWAGRQEFEAPTGRPVLLILIARMLYASAAVIGLVAVALLFAKSKLGSIGGNQVICAAALGLLFHGVLGLTALVELHLTRYTVPVWPVVCILLGMSGAAILNSSYFQGMARLREWRVRSGDRHTASVGNRRNARRIVSRRLY